MLLCVFVFLGNYLKGHTSRYEKYIHQNSDPIIIKYDSQLSLLLLSPMHGSIYILSHHSSLARAQYCHLNSLSLPL
jgi:hypothetical protein